MKKKRRFQIMNIIVCLGLAILLFIAGSVMQVKADSQTDDFEEAVENAKQYENNIILDALGLKSWEEWVECDVIKGYDQPLGEYDPDVIRQYTNRNITVEILYGIGDTRDGRREINPDGFQSGGMIQYIKIYEDGELICVCAYQWNSVYIEESQWGYENDN